MPSFFRLLDLPSEVLSNILGNFADGKSISTFLVVVQGSQSDGAIQVLDLIRNALFHRYGLLQECLHTHTEITDLLMVLREDVRMNESVYKFPEWCAVLDYFESQMNWNQTAGEDTCIVWCGSIETVFGTFEACLRCPLERWTLGALHYWHHEVEMNQFAIVHPFSHDLSNQSFDLTLLYGTIEGLQEHDQVILERQHVDLEDDPASWQHYLVLRPKTYEEQPSEFFSPITGVKSALFCYWDYTEQNYDWEECLARLGEDATRVMKRYSKARGSFP